jgi:hypothetical protein
MQEVWYIDEWRISGIVRFGFATYAVTGGLIYSLRELVNVYHI